VQSIGGTGSLIVGGSTEVFEKDFKLPDKPFHLTVVSLREIPGVTDAGLANLSGLSQLQKLELPGAQITDAGLACLADLQSLRLLSLAGTPVGDAGMHHIGKLKGLADLSLRETKVTGRGLQHLVGLPNLRVLNLMTIDLGGDGLRALENPTQLRMLDLSGGTQVTDADLPHLLKLQKVECLSLCVGGPGYIAAARLADLSTLPRLRGLLLSANEWANIQTVDGLLKLEKLEFLRLHVKRGQIPAAGLGDLAKLPHLRTLCLDGGEWSGSPTVDAVAKLSQLRELYLNCDVGPGKEEPDVAALRKALPNCRIEIGPEAAWAAMNKYLWQFVEEVHTATDPDRRAAEVEGVPGANVQPSADGGPSGAEGDAKPQEPASPKPAE
jgi:hypothetical protein